MPSTTRLLPLSGSAPGGVPMLISAAAAPGNTLHTGSSSANDIDRITIKVHNFSDAVLTFTLNWTGAGAPMVIKDIPPKSAEFVLVEALPLQGAATPTVIYGWASAAYAVLVSGDVIRITQT